ncbi:kallikrein-7-like [Artibeus jamaicensis]|uniref:kallikrein-7-like n=1 Tax=Artibeus jamaicensis TaxID=9417 RepID=UPI00235A8453|nr:kallikrein-7-like [Artibeus jamaicensis]
MAGSLHMPLLILLLSLTLGAAGQGGEADNTEKKIVNGLPCPRGSQPGQVALLSDREFQCSGVLLSELWVLTVASCNMSEYTVHMGSDLLDDDKAVKIRATESFVHPRFQSQNYIHDLMLVKLSRPALLSEAVRKVTLPSRCKHPGANCTFSGWDGRDTNLVTQPSVLRCANVTLISHKVCGKLHSARPKTHMMCTAAPARVPCAYRSALSQFPAFLGCHSQSRQT